MVQGTGLSFHCWLLNQFCLWTNSNSIYECYFPGNLNVGHVAVNLLVHKWGYKPVCLYSSHGQVLLSWLHVTEVVWKVRIWMPHTVPTQIPPWAPVTYPPQSTWLGRTSPSVPCRLQAALTGLHHLVREPLLCRTPQWSCLTPYMLTSVG